MLSENPPQVPHFLVQKTRVAEGIGALRYFLLRADARVEPGTIRPPGGRAGVPGPGVCQLRRIRAAAWALAQRREGGATIISGGGAGRCACWLLIRK